ncbi:MAG: InlB B-repeat-containing protein, partial [Oscillospiraceae bacterium]|nr:InlB B-repeat-containing protein [Oscillospiraceae bacterium]
FEAILRIENANDTGLTQATILGTWYAKAGSNIKVNSTYTGSGDNRKGSHEVVCVIDGVEYPVYRDAALSQKASLADVYSTYFVYNNTGTAWTDEVNWDDVYTGGEVPYSKRPVSSSGDTIINFDYMRVRSDVKFVFSNESAYFDIFKLYRDGLLTGSVSYSGTKPTTTGENVSASGISCTNVSCTYTAASGNGNNVYTLLNVKYGQRIYDDYPVGGKWLTVGNTKFYTWDCNGTNFTSRREDLSDAFFKGSGRSATAYQLNAEFKGYDQTALMYAIECLPGETADFTIGGIGYKVQTHLSEVVNSSSNFSAKELLGCTAGVNPKANSSTKYYTKLNSNNESVGGTSVKTLFGTTYWQYYDKYTGIDSLSDIDRAYIFYYNRLDLSISFNFTYDANGNGDNESVTYENIAFGTPIAEYQFGAAGNNKHPLLEREGYEFVGWLDANGIVLEEEDWKSMVASGDSENNSMIFIAKWEKISNNIVEYYDDRSSTEAFETHYFEDGELVPYPTMAAYPDAWVWQEYGEGPFQRFDWDVPMYGEYGVQELRKIGNEDRVVNVIRIYGNWDEAHTKVAYDPNAPQGGVPGTAPIDYNEYTIWRSDVPVASRGETANADPEMVFVGWQLDRNGIVYQPGDHVPVQWPRTMVFTAQWADADEVVRLRYDPNGGSPEHVYPDDNGFEYKANATAVVWDNSGADGAAWFSQSGSAFVGWNTEPDGSGTAYAPGASIVLTAPVTTLYAQWEKTSYTLSLYKVDSADNRALIGA